MIKRYSCTLLLSSKSSCRTHMLNGCKANQYLPLFLGTILDQMGKWCLPCIFHLSGCTTSSAVLNSRKQGKNKAKQRWIFSLKNYYTIYSLLKKRQPGKMNSYPIILFSCSMLLVTVTMNFYSDSLFSLLLGPNMSIATDRLFSTKKNLFL